MKVAFYKATRPGIQGWFNRAVRWWTNGPYSHCEVVLNVLSDGSCQCASSSFIDGGVRLKTIKLDPEHWDVVDYPADRYAVIEWFSQQHGKKYDTLGLFGFIWRRADGHKKRWHCSESVAAALGFEQPWRLDPNSLYWVLRFNAILKPI
jgi:surface antigen